MRQLTLQAAGRPEVLEGVTADVALIKLCMGFLHTLEHVGVGAHCPPEALDRLRCRRLERARRSASWLVPQPAQPLPATAALGACAQIQQSCSSPAC